MCGVSVTPGWSKIGVVRRGLGLEHVEADPGELPGLQRGEGGVEVEQPAAAAVDQHGARLGAAEELAVHHVVVLRR